MPTTPSLRRIALILAGLLVLTAVVSLLTSTVVAFDAALVLVLGALPLRKPDFLSKASPLKLASLAVVPLIFAVCALLIDHSWISGVVVLLVGAAVGFIWRMIRRLTAPGELISYSLSHALQEAGVTVAEEPTGGWTSGVSTRGAVLLVREITSGTGPVDSWSQLASLRTSASSTAQTLAAQSISPHMIVVASGSSNLLHKTSWVTVCSPDRLASVVRSLTPSIVDPVALAKAAGIELSRDVARRVSRTSRPPSSPRPAHQGRVTNPKPRTPTE